MTVYYNYGMLCPDLNVLLLKAIQKNNTQKAQFLINADVSVNVADAEGNLPLHYAREPEVASLLLQAGAFVNHKNYFGRTALFEQFYFAPFYKNFLTQCVIQLFYGADPNQKARISHDEQHILTLGYFHKVPFEAIIALIISGAKTDSEDLKAWISRTYTAMFRKRDQARPCIKLMRGLFLYPHILFASSTQNLNSAVLRDLAITKRNIKKVRTAVKKVRQEFLAIAQDTPALKPTKQKTNIFKALQLREIGKKI